MSHTKKAYFKLSWFLTQIGVTVNSMVSPQLCILTDIPHKCCVICVLFSL